VIRSLHATSSKKARIKPQTVQSPMPYQVSTRTIEALRATLAQVEQQTDLAPDDPSLATLKSILLQRIAELQAVDAAAAQRVEHEALEAAHPASTACEDDSAASLAIDLAVSLLATNPAGRPFEPSANLPVPDLPPPPAAPVQELPAMVDEAAPSDLPPAAS
jgi:hypothetical protein